MYSLCTLKGNLDVFHELNERRKEFNLVNQDFFQAYDNANFFKKLTLIKNVTLLKYGDKFIGYTWVNRIKTSRYKLNSMYVFNEYEKEGFRYLFNKIPKGKIIYYCEINKDNFGLLKDIGFYKTQGTIKMLYDINYFIGVTSNSDLHYETFIKNKHENIRCSLQNEIFKNKSRIPLTIEDIYGDEYQDYYLDYGSIFVKKGNEYVGYGQVILENSYPLIVNFGILNNYRGLGYGKYLLQCLLKIAKDKNFKKVYIKLDSNNEAAFKLYTNTGFSIYKQYYNLELTK